MKLESPINSKDTHELVKKLLQIIGEEGRPVTSFTIEWKIGEPVRTTVSRIQPKAEEEICPPR